VKRKRVCLERCLFAHFSPIACLLAGFLMSCVSLYARYYITLQTTPCQTRPDQTMSCAVSFLFAFASRNLPLAPLKRMKPQNGHVCHCPFRSTMCVPMPMPGGGIGGGTIAVDVVVVQRVDVVAVVNLTASGHTALLFNSNNNFWFVSLHF